MLRAIAALLAASGAAGLVPTRRSVARVINAGGEEDYVNPVTEFLGRFIPKQAPLELGVDWDQPKTPLPLGELAGALDRGLRTLRMDGINKLMSGMTTPEEVLRVTQLDVS